MSLSLSSHELNSTVSLQGKNSQTTDDFGLLAISHIISAFSLYITEVPFMLSCGSALENIQEQKKKNFIWKNMRNMNYSVTQHHYFPFLFIVLSTIVTKKNVRSGVFHFWRHKHQINSCIIFIHYKFVHRRERIT